MSKNTKHMDRVVVINEPLRTPAYSVYRATVLSSKGPKTYIGFTGEGIRKRAQRHVGDPNRSVYNAFHEEPSTIMVIEHLEGARTLERARYLEERHIKREHKRVGNKLLNVHHATSKKK